MPKSMTSGGFTKRYRLTCVTESQIIYAAVHVSPLMETHFDTEMDRQCSLSPCRKSGQHKKVYSIIVTSQTLFSKSLNWMRHGPRKPSPGGIHKFRITSRIWSLPYTTYSQVFCYFWCVYLWLYNAPSKVSSLGSSLVRLLYILQSAKDGKSTLSLISSSAVPLCPLWSRASL